MQLKVKKGRSGSERIGDAGVVGPDRLWGAPVAFCCSVAIGPPTTGPCGGSRCRDRVLWVVREEGVRCATGQAATERRDGAGGRVSRHIAVGISRIVSRSSAFIRIRVRGLRCVPL